MSELIEDQNQSVANEESNELVSDSESVDSQGYSKHDPYAEMAKKIDKKKKIEEEI